MQVVPSYMYLAVAVFPTNDSGGHWWYMYDLVIISICRQPWDIFWLRSCVAAVMDDLEVSSNLTSTSVQDIWENGVIRLKVDICEKYPHVVMQPMPCKWAHGEQELALHDCQAVVCNCKLALLRSCLWCVTAALLSQDFHTSVVCIIFARLFARLGVFCTSTAWQVSCNMLLQDWFNGWCYRQKLMNRQAPRRKHMWCIRSQCHGRSRTGQPCVIFVLLPAVRVEISDGNVRW